MISFFVCFILGGAAYVGLEYLWRGRSHISMFITGGLAFALLDGIFLRYDLPILYKCAAGALIITALEFTAGYIVNLRMELRVWDYSGRRFNLYGQICPEYSLMWAALTLPIAGLSRLLHGWIL
ncbi:MAG: hypothetical protein IJC24_03695 [Clostridia bacterium]|nr:hypothetical protein [Clostridia bacterium]